MSVTHIVKMSQNDLLKQQVAGFYRDVDVQTSNEETNIQKKYNQLEGVEKTGYDEEVYTLYEVHCDLDIEGFEDIDVTTGEPTGIKVPYIVTIDEGSNKILSIYRNYHETDPLRKKIEYLYEIEMEKNILLKTLLCILWVGKNKYLQILKN